MLKPFKQFADVQNDTKFYKQACAEFNEKNQLANISWMREELTPQEYSAILKRAQELKDAAKGEK